ncbi:MAG: TolC family protein [bacterium]|jgi:outer membrane protein
MSKNNYTTYLFIVSFVFLFTTVSAQQKLSLNESIQLGLENNYSIKIAKNQESVSVETRKAGRSAILPKVDANASLNQSINDTRQVFVTGGINERDAAKTTIQNANVLMTWTLFDGLKMFAAYDKLKELEKLGEVNTKAMLQNVVADIIINYYAIVASQEQMKASKEALEVSKSRLTIAENKSNVGSGSTLDLLNAKVDYNADYSTFLKQQETLKNLKIRFNELLILPIDNSFELIDTIPQATILDIKSMYSRLKEQNPQLISAKSRQRIAELNIKEVAADRYPTLRLNSGYNFNNQNAEAGFFIENRNQGFNYGISASINIFNGLLQSKREKIAKIESQSAEMDFLSTQQNLEANWNTLVTSYQNNLTLLQLEGENQQVSKRNLEISNDKYKLGGISSFQLREAQRSYIEANSRFVNALYQYKLAETSLLELAGDLVK